ncbi:hypothetical protein MBH78_16375 [Oceanimonas sp. NS1]|nr:hypothetical protein [Oceanimonas sp. NS1]
MGLLQKEFTALELDLSDWQAFIAAIPFQFYAVLAVTLVPLIALRKLDFGPMAEAERAALRGEIAAGPLHELQPFTHDNARASFVWRRCW